MPLLTNTGFPVTLVTIIALALERARSVFASGLWRAVVLVFAALIHVFEKVLKSGLRDGKGSPVVGTLLTSLPNVCMFSNKRASRYLSRLIRSTAPLFQSLSILNWKKNEYAGEIAHQYRIPRHLGNHHCTCTRTSPQCFRKRPLESSCACVRCTHPRLLGKC